MSIAAVLGSRNSFKTYSCCSTFSNEDLSRLDKQIKLNKLDKPSVLEAKLFRDWEGQHFRDSALQGLDRVIGESYANEFYCVRLGETLDHIQQIKVLHFYENETNLRSLLYVRWQISYFR